MVVAWSTFGPQSIGPQRSPAVSSGTSFAQVPGAILEKQARVQNPDKDEVPGPRPAEDGRQQRTSATRGTYSSATLALRLKLKESASGSRDERVGSENDVAVDGFCGRLLVLK